MSARSWYAAAALVGVASLVACEKAKPAAETGSAASAIPAPDTMKAAPVQVSDSTKIMQAADTKGASSKGTPATIPPKVPGTTKTSTKTLGRDSVDTKPKLIGLPVVKDTARKP